MKWSLKPSRTVSLPVALTLVISIVLVPIVAADGSYHSEHIDLTPVGDAPLRSGFVQNIHANGPQVYAIERYVLNGASPNTIYQVILVFHPFSPDCSPSQEWPAMFIPTATIQTNASGNGTAQHVFVDMDPRARGAAHGVMWMVSIDGGDGTVAYQTACTDAWLD